MLKCAKKNTTYNDDHNKIQWNLVADVISPPVSPQPQIVRLTAANDPNP
jgi:hypothetical protein